MGRALLQQIVDCCTPENLTRFFQAACPDFRKTSFRFSPFKDPVSSQFRSLGEITLETGQKLIVAAAPAGDLNAQECEESQFESTRQLLNKHPEYTAGLFVFVHPDGSFRFSLVCRPAENSRFQRSTWSVRCGQANSQFIERVGGCDFSTLAQIREAFSAERISRDFCKQIVNWYQTAISQGKSRRTSRDFHLAVTRLIIRTLYLRFLEERGLISPAWLDPAHLSGLMAESCPDFAAAPPDSPETENALDSEQLAALLQILDSYDLTAMENSLEDQEVALDPEVLGKVLENLLSGFASGTAATARKSTGSYYTPREIVDYMVVRSLQQYYRTHLISVGGLDDKLTRLFSHTLDNPFSREESSKLVQLTARLRILDPAVGSGAFLMGMLRQLEFILSKLDPDHTLGPASPDRDPGYARKLYLIENCLHGLDLQPLAIEITRMRFSLALLSSGGQCTLPDCHLTAGDSLFSGHQLTGGGFDIVISNPPYVSYGLHHNRQAAQKWADRVRHCYPGSAEYKISLYALFLDLALQLAAEKGVICYLTPDSFLLGRFFSKIRKTLLDQSSVLQLVMLNKDFWKSGVVGRPVISLFQRGVSQEKVTAVLAEDAPALSSSRVLQHSYSQDYFRSVSYNRFRLFFSPLAQRFVETLDSGSRPLMSVARITTGVRSRTSQSEIISLSCQGPAWKRGLISGGQVSRYNIAWAGHYLNIWRDQLFAGGWEPSIVENPKVLIRQTGDSLIAAVDREGLYHLNNVHSLHLTGSQVSLNYICALLNSRLMNRYYHLISLECGRPLAQTDIETLELLPYREPDEVTLAKVETLFPSIQDPAVQEQAEALLEQFYSLDPELVRYLHSDSFYP